LNRNWLFDGTMLWLLPSQRWEMPYAVLFRVTTLSLCWRSVQLHLTLNLTRTWRKKKNKKKIVNKTLRNQNSLFREIITMSQVISAWPKIIKLIDSNLT
jgi:hypothetical protein